jgi:hypothetical protein
VTLLCALGVYGRAQWMCDGCWSVVDINVPGEIDVCDHGDKQGSKQIRQYGIDNSNGVDDIYNV